MPAANHPVSVPIAGRAGPANLTLPAPVRVMSGSISITGGGGTANATLAGLTDVDFTVHPTAGQALVFDGVNSRWTNGRPAWTLPDWTSTHIYEPGDTVYHQGQFWRNIQTSGANKAHEPALLKAEAIGWFRRGGRTIGPLYPEFVEIGDTFLAPTGTIATHFGAHYAVKYHSDTNWTVWEWKVISHGPPIVFGWHKIDVAHKVTHRHYAEPSPVTAEETGLLWIFDEPGSTSTPVVPQRYWEPVVLGDYLVSLADVDASKAVAGDTLVMDANGRWVATPLGTTPGGGGGNYQPILPNTQYGANLPLNANLGWTSTISGEVATEGDKHFAMGVGVSSNLMFTHGMYYSEGSGMYLSGGSIETNSATHDTRMQRMHHESGALVSDASVVVGISSSEMKYLKKVGGKDYSAKINASTYDFQSVGGIDDGKGTFNGTSVKLIGQGSLVKISQSSDILSGAISIASNGTHVMPRLRCTNILKTDDTIATLKDIADATSGGGGGGLDIATANGLYLPSLQTANTPLSTVTNLQRSFGVIGASNSGAIGLSNTTAQIRLVNKSNTDERLVTSCLTLSGITDTVTGTGNLSTSASITSLARTTRVNEGSLAKTTEAINATGVMLTLKASSTPNASNGTGDASYTVIGGSVEFISNTGNGFRYKADHGLTAIAGHTNSTIVDDSYIVRKYADTRYLKAPAAATANQVLTYDGTTWSAANATGGNLSLYVPRTSNAPLVIETTEQASSAVGITIISKYNQYSSNLTIDGSAGFSLQDMRGSTVKSSTQGEVLIIPDTILSPSPTKIRVLVGQVDIPVGPQGANSPTGGITIQQDGSLKALVAPDTSTFADPLSYVTSGHADATYLRISASTTLPYLTQDVADARYPTLDGSATGKYAAYTDNAPGYTGQYVLPDGKVMIIQNGVIVSIS